jgi:putative hydrolase of the HAD superfamily
LTFQELGIENFDEIYSQAKQTTLFDEFETGKITSEKFIYGISKLLNHKIPDDGIVGSWNSMLLDFPVERLNLIKQLKKKYSIVLLSNTNEIHKKAFLAILKNQLQLTDFNDFFHAVYYSHEIGLRKPDAECFEYVLEKSNFKKEETIFFDDSIQHITGAEKIGIKSVWLNNGKTILDFFDENYNIKL